MQSNLTYADATVCHPLPLEVYPAVFLAAFILTRSEYSTFALLQACASTLSLESAMRGFVMLANSYSLPRNLHRCPATSFTSPWILGT